MNNRTKREDKMGTTIELTEEQEAVLDELAGQINESHEAAQSAMRDSLRHAKVAGEKLNEAKETVGHGNWQRWRKENCDFSERTAQYYMQIARDFAKLTESNPQAIAEMTMEAAIEKLAEARRAANQSSRPGKDAFHKESQIGRARRLLGEHAGGFLRPATKEKLYLDIVVNDRELHREEVADVRKVLFELRHRVNEAIDRLTERMLINVDEIDEHAEERQEQMRELNQRIAEIDPSLLPRAPRERIEKPDIGFREQVPQESAA